MEAHVGERVLSRDVRATRSYLSQSELPLTFGLGSAAVVDKLVIRWPNGAVQEVPTPAVDQQLTITQP